MDKYEFVVTLRVVVEAFSPLDAAEVIEDTFGLGSDGGCEVATFEYELADN